MKPKVLKKLRKSLKWNQTETGKYVGYSKTLISYMESGERPITQEFLNRLKNAVQIRITEYKNILDEVTFLVDK